MPLGGHPPEYGGSGQSLGGGDAAGGDGGDTESLPNFDELTKRELMLVGSFFSA